MNRTTKVLGFSVPPAVAREVQTLAKAERRTKSELFREMVRVYQRYREQRERDDERWIMNLIQEARTEQAQNPMSMDDMLRESERLARYGARQAKRLCIKPKDVNRLVHAFRAQQ
jgi:metal-responsive CopG/Arc/MetJ family transcriptional regulator